MFLPLTGLISIGTLCAAPLAQRIGRPAVLGIGQAGLTLALLAVAWASTSSALWPLVLALLPCGFVSGLLVPTMTSQAMAAVESGLHGAASAAFNTSRQIGGAVGIAIFGPLLGSTHNLRDGFITCVIVASVATAVTLLLTLIVHAPSRGAQLPAALRPDSHREIDSIAPHVARQPGACVDQLGSVTGPNSRSLKPSCEATNPSRP